MKNEVKKIEFKLFSRQISFELISQPFPNSSSDWDRDAIDAIIKVNTEQFNGQFNTIIWVHELECLRILLLELDKLIGKESITAIFRLREATVGLIFNLESTGNISIHVEVCDDPFLGTRIEFDIGVDQSFLPIWFNEIEEALKKFPPQIEVKPPNPLYIN